MKDIDQYQSASARTLNPGLDSNQSLANYSMGLAGESGELLEHLKKHLFHGKELDRYAVLKEAGDVMWYLTALMTTMGIDMSEVLRENVLKLQERYPGKFQLGGGIRD